MPSTPAPPDTWSTCQQYRSDPIAYFRFQAEQARVVVLSVVTNDASQAKDRRFAQR